MSKLRKFTTKIPVPATARKSLIKTGFVPSSLASVGLGKTTHETMYNAKTQIQIVNKYAYTQIITDSQT